MSEDAVILVFSECRGTPKEVSMRQIVSDNYLWLPQTDLLQSQKLKSADRQESRAAAQVSHCDVKNYNDGILNKMTDFFHSSSFSSSSSVIKKRLESHL